MNRKASTAPQNAIARRDFIHAGALGLLGLSLQAATPAFTRSRERKACILIWNSGGLSHLDSWDPKPDASSEIRSPFSAISTRGEFQISGAFPHLARVGHLFSVVRGVHFDAAPLHDIGTQIVLTGQLAQGRASIAGEFGASRPVLSSVSEPKHIRERYGLHSVGQRFLAARQAVENGALFVVIDPFERAAWDIHGAAPYGTMDEFGSILAPQYDQAASALIADLSERGLLQTTLVAALSEFGRTPRFNADGGRDHWADCWSICLGGGGVQGGRAVGASDASGSVPEGTGFTPQDVLATIRHVLGAPLTGGGQPISALF